MVIDPLELDRQLCFALAATSREVVRLYKPALAPLGLTHPQYLVMLALWEQSPMHLREIADRLHVEPATLSPLIGRLESAGLLTRTRNADDLVLGHFHVVEESLAERRIAADQQDRLGRDAGHFHVEQQEADAAML